MYICTNDKKSQNLTNLVLSQYENTIKISINREKETKYILKKYWEAIKITRQIKIKLIGSSFKKNKNEKIARVVYYH